MFAAQFMADPLNATLDIPPMHAFIREMTEGSQPEQIRKQLRPADLGPPDGHREAAVQGGLDPPFQGDGQASCNQDLHCQHPGAGHGDAHPTVTDSTEALRFRAACGERITLPLVSRRSASSDSSVSQRSESLRTAG